MWSLRLTRVAGIDIKVHLSFLLILVLGAMQWGGLGPRGALFGAVLTLFVFASVTLHELGHSLVAKAFGIPVKDITLYPFGGVARLGKRPKTPAQELLIALAGPAVNVALAAILGAGGIALFGFDALVDAVARAHVEQPTAMTLVAMLVTSNGLLALFNMLPALPMDGGRVLRAVLSWFIGSNRATLASALVARVLAVGLFVIGLMGMPTLILVAMVVFVGAGQELQEQRIHRVLEGVPVGDIVSPYAPRLSPDATVDEAVRMLAMTNYEAIAVEHFGRLVGVLTASDLRSAALRAPRDYVAGLMRREVPTIDASQSLDVARSQMSEAGLPFVAVVRNGMLLGLITELELAVVAAHLATAEQASGAAAMRRGLHSRF